MATKPTPKWRVFKERVPQEFHPMWVVWDEFQGEFLFRTGIEALVFTHQELTNRALAQTVRGKQDGRLGR